jgi:hypothetical protein
MTCGQRWAPQRRSAGGDNAHVGCAQRLRRVPVQKRQRQLVERQSVRCRFEAIARRSRCQRNEEDRVRARRVEDRRRLQQQLAVHVELRRPAAREQREHRLRQAELELATGFAPRCEHRGVARERMSDKGHRHAGGLVDRRLERKEREHPVDRATDPADAAAPPSPHRRRDQMHGTRAGPLELRFEPEIEIGRVDADKHANALGESLRTRARRNASSAGSCAGLRPGHAA